jgi:serine/threonine protein kinase
LGISLTELALGRFPFADSDDSDDSDFNDFEGTLSPHHADSTVHYGRPLSLQPLPPRPKKKDSKTSQRDKRKSRGVSLEGGGMTMSILELLQHIVNEPAPRLTPEGKFPIESEEFLDLCLKKDPDERPTPKELLVRIMKLTCRVYCTESVRLETPMDHSCPHERCRSRAMGEPIIISFPIPSTCRYCVLLRRSQTSMLLIVISSIPTAVSQGTMYLLCNAARQPNGVR